MGEYAKYGTETIKIGTCEDMLYLRATQAREVRAELGSVDPSSDETRKTLRFRFPWPDEDRVQPGRFDKPFRSVALHGLTIPAEVQHLPVQFKAEAGYLVSLPCPEGPSSHGFTIHRNGFEGSVKIAQQAFRDGVLALICECGGCGAKYRIPTLKDAEPIIVACRNKGKSDGLVTAWWNAVAERIAAGYSS